MDLIRALGAFTRITETGSFAAVARELHASHSAVTRLVGDLETHFGVRLFHRTTRRLTLTEDGGELLRHARQMLDLAEEMETALGLQRSSAQGHVRVGTSVGFGRFLTPRIPALLERHPGLTFELLMRDSFGDMIEERLDVALRRGPIADTSLVTRSMGTFRRVAVAAPVYLERRGAPRTPAELTEHDCLLHQDHGDPGGWRFEGPDGVTEIRVNGRFGADNSEAVRAAALGGQGIAMLWETQVVDDLRAGRLHPVLAEFRSPGEPAFVVYPSRRHLPPRTRAVIDFLVELSRELREPIGPDGQPINAWLV